MPSFIELNGTTYAYDISGKGEPFVLLHGFTGKQTILDYDQSLSGRKLSKC